MSGQAVRFPLLVQVSFDADLVSDAIGDEDFIAEASKWKPNARREANAEAVKTVLEQPANATKINETGQGARKSPRTRPGRRSVIKPEY